VLIGNYVPRARWGVTILAGVRRCRGRGRVQAAIVKEPVRVVGICGTLALVRHQTYVDCAAIIERDGQFVLQIRRHGFRMIPLLY